MGDLVFLAIIIAVVKHFLNNSKEGAKKQGGKQSMPQRTQQREYHPAFEEQDMYEPAQAEAAPEPQKTQLSFEDIMAKAVNAANTVKQAAEQYRPAAGSMVYDSSEGEGHIDGDYRFEEITPRSDDHVVKPFTESRHGHVESTSMGDEICETDVKDSYDVPAVVVSEAEMSDIRKAIIWSEIIGKPRALRQR